MRIEVVIAGWEQSCCGAPFEVDGPVTWHIHALDPAESPAGAPARYAEEHHGQTPDDVPHVTVSGTVRGITGVRYPIVPAPGRPGVSVRDTDHPQFASLLAVGSGDESQHSAYRVVLEVGDAVVLPEYVLSDEARAAAAKRAAEAENARHLSQDELGAVLNVLADFARNAHGGRASISVTGPDGAAGEGAGVAVEPQTPGAAGIAWWRRSDGGVAVRVGDGEWTLPAGRESAHTVAAFLDAASKGSVREVVRTGSEEGEIELVTELTTAKGVRWAAVTPVRSFHFSSGVVALAAPLARRIERGDVDYVPWTSEAARPADA